MNRVFRVIWSRCTNTFIAVHEFAKSHGKSRGLIGSHRRAGTAVILLGMLLGTHVFLSPVAFAATRYWDANGTAVNAGGSGTWNLTNAFWSANNDGVSGPYGAWSNAALDDAVFAGTAGTVTLGLPISLHNLTLQTAGYVITGSTLTLGGVTPTITNTQAATISSILAGSAGLTKAGAGTLTLSGSNTFTGTVNITAGLLSVTTNGALGALANAISIANGASLFSPASLAGRTITLVSGLAGISGAGAGNAHFTGAGGINLASGSLTDNTNDYTGATRFTAQDGTRSFTSIADLGVASALGAPTTVANGTIFFTAAGGATTTLSYIGSGHSSNRNWLISPAGPAAPLRLSNMGTGTLTLTGDIALGGGSMNGVSFDAGTADLKLLGQISSNNNRSVAYTGNTARTLTLGNLNSYNGASSISGVTVQAGSLKDTGVISSLGTGSAGGLTIGSNGTLSYVGAGDSSNRALTLTNGALRNDGTGALQLSGDLTLITNGTLGGAFVGADNIASGVLSGVSSLTKTGASTWNLSGANTYTGTTIVNGGILRAQNAQAFGIMNAAVVNGGVLDFNNFNASLPTLAGTGGSVALGNGSLTLNAASGISSSYAGSITGSGGLTKLGLSTQTLSGANTYTGATTINGGALNLDYRLGGAPVNNIIASASTLQMGGANLNVNGANGVSNTQTFNGLNITGGNNRINAVAGTGGSFTLNLGAITRTSGRVDFGLPSSGNITTSNTTLGGWATVNGTDYAKVVGGNITAFTLADYAHKDNAATWLANDIITDTNGFFGTVGSSVQIGGLRYTRPVATTVTIANGQLMGVDGTIIVSPSVLNFNQLITGGSITGTLGGGSLGILQDSAGNFTLASQIVDNGGSIGFTKAGTGLVTLSNASNNYTGATVVTEGTLSVNSIANGGVASSIGASTASPDNLVLENATLQYTGVSTASDRGMTLAGTAGVSVTNAATDLNFSGQVTSGPNATLTKTGAGTLTLSNAANNYTGATTVSGGVLAVNTIANGGVASGLGVSDSSSGNLVLAGGALRYLGGSADSDRGFTLGTGGGAIDVSNGVTTLGLSGVARGTGALTKQGSGTLVLAGTNTYSGGTQISAGTLRAGSTQAFGPGGITLANTAGATLDLAGFSNTVAFLAGGGVNGGNVTLGSATLTLNGTGSASYAGAISGSGGLVRAAASGAATQTLTGCNSSYTGGTSIIGSTLNVDCLANGGVNSSIGASGSASANLSLSNGTLNYTGASVSTDRGIALSSSGNRIGVTNAATTLQFSGPLIGSNLQKAGPGTLLLSGTNTYTGGTTVLGGILRAGSNTAFGTGGISLANTAGVLLDLAGFSNTQAFLTGGGTTGGDVNLGAATLTLNPGGTIAQTYAGAITGTGGLIKNGNGSQTLSGCNSAYSGSTVINAGTLAVNCLNDGGSNSSIGSASAAATNLVINGGTLQYLGTGSSSNRLFTLGTNGGTLDASGSGALVLSSTAPVVSAGTNTARLLTLTGTNTDNNQLHAQLTDNGSGVLSLTKTGTGLWELANVASTYTGKTTINGGVLSVAHLTDGGQSSSIGASSNAASNVVIGNGSTLRYVGSGDTSNRLFTLSSGTTFIESSGSGALKLTNTGPVTLTGTNTPRTIALGGTNTDDNTLGGVIGDNGTGSTTLAKNDSGTWVLTGNNTFTGNTVINNGNLVIGNGGTSGNAGSGNVIIDSASSILSINRGDSFAFGGTLSGPGTLAQVGTGTTRLTALGSTVGATRISAGTLDVDGGLITPTIALSNNAALVVSGTVQAAGGSTTLLTGDAGASSVTVDAGGVLRAQGDLGDGADAVTLSGILDTDTGALSLGAGDDTFTLNDGADLRGLGIEGGAAGTDTLTVNNALALSFNGDRLSGFERLRKTSAGTLSLTGSQAFSAGTQIDDGTLQVQGDLQTTSVTMADGTTLDVSGTVEAAGGTATQLLGSSGVNTVTVNDGALLRAQGDLGDGQDRVTVSGTLDTGGATLSLGAGDDTLVLNDGAVLSGAGIDAGSAVNNDLLMLNNAFALTFDASQTAGFEQLFKQGSGATTMTGDQTFDASVFVAQGSLTVEGNVTTPFVGLQDDTALTVNGSLQASGAAAALISGSTGANTLTINGTAVASGDLGAGNDVLDVAGSLDTDGGVLDLGDGDDTLTIHDGTSITGTVVAGAGTDTFNTQIATSADLGAVQGFETLSKTGLGVLNVTGPMSSDFTHVDVLEGTLKVDTNGSVIAAPGNTLQTLIAAGATLQVDGSYGCGAGDDSLSVSGRLSGSGVVDLCDGNDTLTVNDGGQVETAISGGAGSDDRLVLNNTSALTLNVTALTAFERLQKEQGGEATVTGDQSFSAGTEVNGGTLTVAGNLETPLVNLADDTRLQVDGSLQGSGGSAAQLTGSAGANTVAVGAGAILRANGDLGAGDDVLDVVGTLDAGVGGSLLLGDGDDTFVVHDGSTIIGTVSGGNGQDTQVYDLAGVANVDAVVDFEGLTKRGLGTLNLTGPAVSELSSVVVEAGTLDVQAGATVTAQVGSALNTEVRSGATLNIDGTWTNSQLSDRLDIAGVVSGSGSLNLAGGDDVLVLRDGANLAGLAQAIDGGVGTDEVVADIAGTATLGGATNFEVLTKTNLGTLIIDGPAMSDFTTVAVDEGTLDVSATGSVDGVTLTTVASGATLNVDGHYGGSSGNDTVTVAGAISGSGDIALGDGDDRVTLNEGANLSGLTGSLDGGAGPGTDLLQLNNATALSVGDAVRNFEALQKDNVGVATLTGTQAFSQGATINAGTLAVDGTLDTPVINMSNTSDTTTLQVNGVVEAAGGSTVLTGSAGVNVVQVSSGAVLRATGDLGAGNDTLDVAGTLDAGATGSMTLGDGDDTFVVRDGTTVIGTVVGGAGVDTRVYDLAGTASVGALTEFEGLTKRGLGTLSLSGPAASELVNTVVENGMLDIQAGSSVVAQAGSSLNADVWNGATLNVDGSWTGSALTDRLDIAGRLSGSGQVQLADGDDVLVLHDGTDLSGLLNAVDGGAHTPAGDAVVLDVAASFTLDGAKIVNFEHLEKQNLGTATLIGAQTWNDVTVAGGTLALGTGSTATTFEADTLTLADDTALLVAAGSTASGTTGAAVALTGSAGSNTVTVAQGGTLNATGSLGDGNDTLDVAGTLNIAGILDLGAGDDTFKVYDTTTVTGALEAGAGNDTLSTHVSAPNVASLGSLNGFESLEKTGEGTLRLTGNSTFIDTAIRAGTLLASGNVITQTATLAAGATLALAGGTLSGTSGSDVFDLAGQVTGTGALDLGAGDDQLTIRDGADLSGLVGALDAGTGVDTLQADISTAATLGDTLNVETLNKTGAGVLTLGGAGASDFASIAVNAGTLAIAAGTTVTAPANGALAATVAQGATLAVDGTFGCGANNDTLQVSGALSGSGRIDLCGGDDTVTLHEGANLSAFSGALVGGSNSAIGDTLVLDNASPLTLASGQVTQFEVLRKRNTGLLTLQGEQSFSRMTTVENGQLDVAGRLTSEAVTIGPDATLQGSGTIVGNVTNQGTLSPGGYLGTLNVEGNVTLARGSVFAADVDAAGASDRLAVTGAVLIEGGTLELANTAGTYAPGRQWTLISAGAGVTGTFDQSRFALPFLDLTVGYDPNRVFLQVQRNDTPFTSFASTRNERDLADGLASLNEGSSLLNSVLNLTDAQAVRNAYNLLSGELHSSVFGALLDDSRFIRQATLNRSCHAEREQRDPYAIEDPRLSTCLDMPQDRVGNATIWAQAIGSSATTDSSGNTAKVDRNIAGLYLGGDVPVSQNWRVGLVTGYENHNIDVNARQSSAGVHSWHVGAYANGLYGPLGLHVGVVHTAHNVETKRKLELASTRQTLKADYDVATDQVFGEVSYTLSAKGVALEPFAGLVYVHQGGDNGFQESGGSAALKGEDTTEHLMYSTLGVRAAAHVGKIGKARLSATGSVGWQHLLEGYTPERTYAFEGSRGFDIQGAPIGRDSVPVEAGLALDFSSQAKVSVGYRGQFSSGYADHGVTASVSIPF